MPGCAPKARILAGSRPLTHPLGSHVESMEALVADQDRGEWHICPERQVFETQRKLGVRPLGDCAAELSIGVVTERHRATIGNCQDLLSTFRPVLARARSDPIVLGTPRF